jgi:hypothetical protein
MSTTALDVDSRERAPSSEQGVLGLARDPHLGQDKPTATSTSTLAAPAAEQLDLATALKASEEISYEMVLERLIEKVLYTAAERAGAQRGLLIVPRGDELYIEAEAMAAGDQVTVYLGESVNSTPALPESVLRSVVRTGQAVLLDDAAAPNAFSADPYIARHATGSILCPDERAQAQAVKANVVGYFVKPFAADELLACVRRAVQRHDVGGE